MIDSVITQAYGTPKPENFRDQVKHKYFCDVVQGDVSNDVAVENSASVTANDWIPTGSVCYISKGIASATAGKASATKAVVPQIVTVGTEHPNVPSEKFNSGCGLITAIPLTVGNKYMTSVFNEEAYEEGDYLTVGTFTFDGKEVTGIKKATTGVGTDVIVGIVEAVGPYHLGGKGLVFQAQFIPATVGA